MLPFALFGCDVDVQVAKLALSLLILGAIAGTAILGRQLLHLEASIVLGACVASAAGVAVANYVVFKYAHAQG